MTRTTFLDTGTGPPNAEATVLRAELAARGGNVARTAIELDVCRRTLDRRIVSLGLRAWLTTTYPPARGMRARRPALTEAPARPSVGTRFDPDGYTF